MFWPAIAADFENLASYLFFCIHIYISGHYICEHIHVVHSLQNPLTADPLCGRASIIVCVYVYLTLLQ